MDGRLITNLLPVKPMVDEVGIFSFSHAGIAATNVLSQYGSELEGIEYLVGYENPTVDCLTTLEAGYIDETGITWENPFYQYPASYSQTEIRLSYGTVRWDETYMGDSRSIPADPISTWMVMPSLMTVISPSAMRYPSLRAGGIIPPP